MLLRRSGRSARLVASAALLSLGSVVAAADSEVVTCVATGYAVVISNEGSEPIDEGTAINWVVPFVRMSIAEALEPGRSIHLSSALGSNFVDRERACQASLD
jgi:hypothetical protein